MGVEAVTYSRFHRGLDGCPPTADWVWDSGWLGTHLDVGAQLQHVIPESVWGLGYDVSEKHSEKNLHVT